MSKAEKTKAFIIEKSSPIFNMKGYSGTSLNDITEATGLTKGSIYGNFEDKDAIALAVYKYQINGLTKRFTELTDAHELAIDKLHAFMSYYRNNWKLTFERGGCPILNASIEADDNLPFLKKSVQDSISAWIKYIAGMIELGKKQNQFKKNINAVEYANIIVMTIEGGIMMGKIHNDKGPLFTALERIEKIINEELRK